MRLFLRALFAVRLRVILRNPIAYWLHMPKARYQTFAGHLRWSVCSVCGKPHGTRGFLLRDGTDKWFCFSCYLKNWQDTQWNH